MLARSFEGPVQRRELRKWASWKRVCGGGCVFFFFEKNGFMQSGSGSELGVRPFVNCVCWPCYWKIYSSNISCQCFDHEGTILVSQKSSAAEEGFGCFFQQFIELLDIIRRGKRNLPVGFNTGGQRYLKCLSLWGLTSVCYSVESTLLMQLLRKKIASFIQTVQLDAKCSAVRIKSVFLIAVIYKLTANDA